MDMPALSRRALALLLAALLAGCAAPRGGDPLAPRLEALLPADAILLGEQHDAPDHQRVHRDVVTALAARGRLAALALEMAEQGHDTQGLPADAGEAQVRDALAWSEAAWPWRAYGPAVMAAVRAGVPVLGANLPRAQMRERMADQRLDGLLSATALRAQQQRIREGHCGALPEDRIAPMTRVQIARDIAMAQTVRAAAVADKTVLLLTGRGHADRALGVPLHLPADFKLQAVGIGTDSAPDGSAAPPVFDAVWPAAPGPAVDHCAALRERRDFRPAS